MAARSKMSTESRARIIQAALTCFSRQGHKHTTMDDIVAESGLSKGTLYWYFESKEDLLESVINSWLEAHLSEELPTLLARYPTASAKLRALIQGMMEFSGQIEDFFNLFVEFWVSSSHREEVSRVWLAPLLQYEPFIVAIIEEGISTGEFKPVDAKSLAWAIMAAYDGLAAYTMFKPDLDLAQISGVLIMTLLQGLEVEF
jgi:TetR/AcrR family transcriptional regulator, fatty acid metabolism regulator protein